MTARKPGRPPHRCECGDTAFVRLTGPWTAIVDADNMPMLQRGRWTAKPEIRNVYAQRTEQGKKVLLHKLVLPLDGGLIPDHRDRNGLDCRRRNLRPATHQQNIMNSAGQAKRKSRYKGVNRRKDRAQWYASIGLDGKKIFIGYFDTEEAAAKAYDAKAKELHQEFAFLNFKETM